MEGKEREVVHLDENPSLSMSMLRNWWNQAWTWWNRFRSPRAGQQSAPVPLAPVGPPASAPPPPPPAPEPGRPFEGLSVQRFGRHSDNNKSLDRTRIWYKSEDLFKTKAYMDSLKHFFAYLSDPQTGNVRLQDKDPGPGFEFELIQGSAQIQGSVDQDQLEARVPLVRMVRPQTAVMRRLLDLNYHLNYSQGALDDQGTLYLIFRSSLETASPQKMYFGLRELAIHADRQDDLFLSDFGELRAVPPRVIEPLPAQELEVKYRYFRLWIQEALDLADKRNPDSEATAISYVLLGLIYRISFLLAPDGKLLAELESIQAKFWETRETQTPVQRNKNLHLALKKLLDLSPQEFSGSLYRSVATFSAVLPPHASKLREIFINAARDAVRYRDEKEGELAWRVAEYAILYPHFVFSLASIQTELTQVLMSVWHEAFFRELGLKHPYYLKEENQIQAPRIAWAVEQILTPFLEKYPGIQWDHNQISYDNPFDFGLHFSEMILGINLQTQRI